MEPMHWTSQMGRSRSRQTGILIGDKKEWWDSWKPKGVVEAVRLWCVKFYLWRGEVICCCCDASSNVLGIFKKKNRKKEKGKKITRKVRYTLIHSANWRTEGTVEQMRFRYPISGACPIIKTQSTGEREGTDTRTTRIRAEWNLLRSVASVLWFATYPKWSANQGPAKYCDNVTLTSVYLKKELQRNTSEGRESEDSLSPSI
jgi:hypothetical protein